jgi:hypothetical protein
MVLQCGSEGGNRAGLAFPQAILLKEGKKCPLHSLILRMLG